MWRITEWLPDRIDYLAIWFMSWRIRKGWGGDCEVLDYEDFKDSPHELNAPSRCGSCQAKEVLIWLNRWRTLNADISAPPKVSNVGGAGNE